MYNRLAVVRCLHVYAHVLLSLSLSLVSVLHIDNSADLFVNVSLTRAAWYRTNNLLIPFGCDFQFQNAWMAYKNMVRISVMLQRMKGLLWLRFKGHMPLCLCGYACVSG